MVDSLSLPWVFPFEEHGAFESSVRCHHRRTASLRVDVDFRVSGLGAWYPIGSALPPRSLDLAILTLVVFGSQPGGVA